MDGLRDSMTLHLGTWHGYKIANESIFAKYLPSFLGQAFHTVYPMAKIVMKPKLSQLEQFFNFLMAAYPGFRADLLFLQQHTTQDNPFKGDIDNLVNLFEFLLPIVSKILIFNKHSS